MSPYCSPRMEAAVFSETLQPAVSNCMTPLYKLSSFSPSQIRKGHSLQFEKNNKKLTTECGATQTVKVIFCFAQAAVRAAETTCGFESNIQYSCCGFARYGTVKFVIAELIPQSLQLPAQEAGRVREVACAQNMQSSYYGLPSYGNVVCYIRTNSTKSPGSGAGNVNEHRLKSQAESVREVVCAQNMQHSYCGLPRYGNVKSDTAKLIPKVSSLRRR